MKKIIEKLENKWKCFERDTFYLKQCDTSHNKKQSYLNVLFNAANVSKLQGVQEAFSCEFHPEIKDFYKNLISFKFFSFFKITIVI